MVKVMIADDHALIRRIVREVVEKESDLELIAEARDGNEAEEQATHTQPDVILMDLNMPGCNGFEATERVLARSPHSRIVIFTASSKEQYALHALQLGAIGYITKDIEPDGLVNAIRSAARNEICIPRSLSSQVLTHLRSLRNISNHASSLTQEDADEAPAIATTGTPAISYKIPQRPTAQSLNATGQERPLTGREHEILNLMRKGRKNREIAQELAIAESTVHKHIQNIFEKLHARNRIEAIYLTRLA